MKAQRTLSLPLLLLLAAACPARAEDGPAPDAAEREARWNRHVKDLDAEEFATREDASKELIAAGLPVLPFLKQAGHLAQSPEVKVRIDRVRKHILFAHPDRVLRVALEVPDKPIYLGVGTGSVAVTAWVENVCDEPVTVCKAIGRGPIDQPGSMYFFTMKDEKGNLCAEHHTSIRCGITQALAKDDFAVLKLGERVQVDASAVCGFNLKSYPDAKPGTYRLTLSYIQVGCLLGDLTAVGRLLDQCIPGTFVSEPLELVFRETLPDDTLIAVLSGKQVDGVSIEDALLTLSWCKKSRAVKPICRFLNDPDPAMRFLAAKALYFMQQPSSAYALITAAHDPVENVSNMARGALFGLPGVRTVDFFVERCLESPDRHLRSLAIQRLVKERQKLEEDVGENANFGFDQSLAPDDPKAKEPVAAWKKWWAEHRAAYEAAQPEQKEDKE